MKNWRKKVNKFEKDVLERLDQIEADIILLQHSITAINKELDDNTDIEDWEIDDE